MNTHKKIITELSACEEKLDTVLFDRGDGMAGAGALGLGGIGVGAGLYARGRKGLQRPKVWDARDIGHTIGRGVSGVGQDLSEGASAAGSSLSGLWETLLKKSKSLLPK